MQSVLDFWFEELAPMQWWQKNPELDQIIRDRFGKINQEAARGECASWRESSEGRLAEIIVLDQFSRNIFRESAQAFANDGMAVLLTQEAIRVGADKTLRPAQRSFLYMPLMHSESADIHEIAVKMFSQAGMEDNLEFEMKHKVIIDRFGRYPHRNAILNRASSPEEIAFLQEPNSSF